MALEDYEDYEEFANAPYETSYKLIETTNCDSLGNPSKTINQEDPKDCRDLAKDGFRLELLFWIKWVDSIGSGIYLFTHTCQKFKNIHRAIYIPNFALNDDKVLGEHNWREKNIVYGRLF